MEVVATTNGGIGPAGRYRRGEVICLMATCLVLVGCVAPQPSETAADASGAGETTADHSLVNAVPAPVPLRDKLGTHLLGLVDGYSENGNAGAMAYAEANRVGVLEDRVSIRIVAASNQHANALMREIDTAGGSVQSLFENVVFASLPIAAIERVLRGEAVWRADLQQPTFAPPILRPGRDGADSEPETAAGGADPDTEYNPPENTNGSK